MPLLDGGNNTNNNNNNHRTIAKKYYYVSLSFTIIIISFSIFSLFHPIFDFDLDFNAMAQEITSNINTQAIPIGTQALTPTTTLEFDAGVLFVTVFLRDATSPEVDLEFDLSDIVIEIQESTAVPNFFTPPENQAQKVLVSPGKYNVKAFFKVDLDNDGGFILIDIEKLNLVNNNDDTIEDVIEFDGACDATISKDEQKACSIRIVIDDDTLAELLDLANLEGEVGELALVGVGNEDADTEEQPENTLLGITSANTASGRLPIDVCKLSETGVGINVDKFRPLAASYNFDATTSISEIKEILRSTNVKVDAGYPDKRLKPITFEIGFDNSPFADNAKLTVANSLFKSEIYSEQEPFNDRTAGFQIKRIYTDCKFVSIAKAPTKYDGSSASSVEGKKVYPLGQRDKVPPEKAQVPADIDESLDFKLGTQNNGLVPGIVGEESILGLGTSNDKNILNPPFIDCSNKFSGETRTRTATTDTLKNQLSFYKIIGAIDTKDLSEFNGNQQVRLEVVVDLINKDQAVITENNNDLIKLNFIINPGESNAKSVPLALQEISTDCKSISYADTLVQDF